jgi:hypothetical protein
MPTRPLMASSILAAVVKSGLRRARVRWSALVEVVSEFAFDARTVGDRASRWCAARFARPCCLDIDAADDDGALSDGVDSHCLRL